MDFLVCWVTNIVVIMICCYILRLTLAESGLRKYAEVALGIILMIVMLSPLFDIDIESRLTNLIDEDLYLTNFEPEKPGIYDEIEKSETLNYVALDVSIKVLESMIMANLKKIYDDMSILYSNKIEICVDFDKDDNALFVNVMNMAPECKKYENEIKKTLSQTCNIDADCIYLHFNEVSE